MDIGRKEVAGMERALFEELRARGWRAAPDWRGPYRWVSGAWSCEWIADEALHRWTGHSWETASPLEAEAIARAWLRSTHPRRASKAKALRKAALALLRESEADQAERWAKGRDAMLEAAQRGDVRQIRSLLPEVDPRRCHHPHLGSTPLIEAARAGRPDCARALLPHSDASANDRDGVTALMEAAARGSVECVELLLSASDLEASSRNGHSPLMRAALSGSSACVAAILAALRDPKRAARKLSSAGWSALCHAARAGDLASVQLLLPLSDAKSIDVDICPLALAAEAGASRCVAALLPASDARQRRRARGPPPPSGSESSGHGRALGGAFLRMRGSGAAPVPRNARRVSGRRAGARSSKTA